MDKDKENSGDVLENELNIATNSPKWPKNQVVKKLKIRASIIFTLSDKFGQQDSYLGLLDTGSTGGLIDETLVQKYKLETKLDNSCWDTNAGVFETRFKAILHCLCFPQFTNKSTTDNIKLYINQNEYCDHKKSYEIK